MTEERVGEKEREIPEILCPLERDFPEETGGLTTCYATALALQKAKADGVRTAWDRAQVMKPCPIGSAGNCCNTCIMGPCRVAPGKEGRTAGICGASVETIAARNFAKMVAQGSASHSDHGRHVAEVFIRVARGEAPSYEIRDWPKLYAVAADLGVETDGREVNAIAEEVGQIVLAQFGQQEGELAFFRRAPQTRQKIWRKTGIASRGIDREIVETLSRVNMGMDQDYRSIMRQVSRCALSDGWGGSMIATELQDILLGTPIPTRGKANFGVLKEDYVNLVVQTGCSAIADAKQGLLLPEAMAWAGPGLREVCEALGIPPVLHTGSCVDNSRILIALTEMVKEGGLGEDISDLPAAGAAPDWINAKALAIGEYFVASGCLVVVRPELPIRGSEVFSKYLLEEYEDIYGGRWAMATTPKEMAEIMIAHIDSKRKALGIDKKRERILYDMAMRRELRV